MDCLRPAYVGLWIRIWRRLEDAGGRCNYGQRRRGYKHGCGTLNQSIIQQASHLVYHRSLSSYRSTLTYTHYNKYSPFPQPRCSSPLSPSSPRSPPLLLPPTFLPTELPPLVLTTPLVPVLLPLPEPGQPQPSPSLVEPQTLAAQPLVSS